MENTWIKLFNGIYTIAKNDLKNTIFFTKQEKDNLQ